MTDLMNLVMLICAAVGSMAFGVLAAYWIFRIGFALMRPQQPSQVVVAVKPSPETAGTL
jgi:hypothetical protein